MTPAPCLLRAPLAGRAAPTAAAASGSSSPVRLAVPPAGDGRRWGGVLGPSAPNSRSARGLCPLAAAATDEYLVRMKEYKESGDWEAAIAELVACNKSGTMADEDHYEAAVSACDETGQWLKALEMLNTARVLGVTPTEETYRSALRACATGEQYVKAIEVLNQMREDCDPDVKVHNEVVFLASICKTRPWKQVETLLAAMEAEGPKPTQLTWIRYIGLLGKAGEIEEAERILDARRKDFTMDADLHGMYNTLITSSMRVGDGERADLFMEERDYLYD